MSVSLSTTTTEAGRLSLLPANNKPTFQTQSPSLTSTVVKAVNLSRLTKCIANSKVFKWLQADCSFFCFKKSHFIRRWALRLVEWRTCLVVIAINCASIAMINPCELNTHCTTFRCRILEIVDHVVSLFFLLEMLIRMLAHCAVGLSTAYLANSWNRLDFVIVLASVMEFGFASGTASNWTLIRAIRILRPIRAIKRIPSLRLLVTLLCDTLPALSSIIALIIFIYFIFGIIGVQLWSGVLRQRCYIDSSALLGDKQTSNSTSNSSSSSRNYFDAREPIGAVFFDVQVASADDLYYETRPSNSFEFNEDNSSEFFEERHLMPVFFKTLTMPDFVCGGVLQCSEVSSFEKHHSMCGTVFEDDVDDPFLRDIAHNSRLHCEQLIENNSYNQCKASQVNPLNGGISFDNIFVAFITIFQAVSPEGWTDVMYIVQDAYSFWAWPYFVFLVAIVTFGISNLSFIIVAVQIPQTKRRLATKIKEEEAEAKKTAVSTWFSSVVEKPIPAVDFSDTSATKSPSWARRFKAVASGSKEDNLNTSRWTVNENETRNFYTLLVDITVDFIRELMPRCRKKPEDEKCSNLAPTAEKRTPSCWQSCSQKLAKSREICRRLVNHVATTIFIATAILVNTILLAAEHHNQPELLTSVAEWMNIVFTILFTAEVLIRMYAIGFAGIVRDGFNMLDLIIVVISLIDLTQSTGSRLSVLRTFRLLRIVKLLRFLPAMQQQLTALFRTVNNVAPFLVLFGLFLFIFCVLGMSLFGCKHCTDQIFPIPDSNLSRSCANNREKSDRFAYEPHSNFDSLLASLLSVLKVLTQDDGWADVLRDTMFIMTSNWPAIYFVCLVMFGNYVILSMLLAIIDVGSSPTAARIIKSQAAGLRFSGTKSSRRSDCTTLSEAGSCSLDDYWATRRPSYSRAMKCPINTTPFDSRSMSSYRQAIELNPITTPLIANRRQRFKKQRPWSPPHYSNIAGRISRRRKSYQMAVTPNSTEKPNDLAISDDRRRSPRPASLSSAGEGSQLFPRRRLSSSMSDEGWDLESLSDAFESLVSTPMIQLKYPNNHKTKIIKNIPKSSPPGQYPPKLVPKIVIEDFDASIGSEASNLKDDSSSSSGDRSVFAVVSHSRNLTASMTTAPTDLANKPSTKSSKSRRDYSLFLFSKPNRLRRFLVLLTDSPSYDKVMLVVVALSCVTVMLERPSVQADSAERLALNSANYFFSAIFFAEAVMKIIACGFILGSGAYLKRGWNVLDFILVLLSIADLAVEFGAYHGATTAAAKAFRGLRLLRTFRPLRAINRTPGLKVVTRMMGTSIKSMANVFFVCSIFYFAFAVLGLQMLRGCFYRCVVADDSDKAHLDPATTRPYNLTTTTEFTPNQTLLEAPLSRRSLNNLKMQLVGVRTRSECLAIEGLEWQNAEHNFDNFLASLRALMVVATLDGWVEITQNGLNCVAVDQQPIENYNPWRLIFFLTFLVLIGFCVVEMFIGVICNNYRHMKGQLIREVDATLNLVTLAGKNLEKMSSRLLKRRGALPTLAPSGVDLVAFWLKYPAWRQRLFHICNNFYLDMTISLLIAANVIIMAAEHYMMPPDLVLAFKILNYVFTAVFTLEILAKVVAFGPRRYCRDRWNQLDIAVCLLSLGDIVLEDIATMRLVLAVNPKIVRVVRVVRVVRALKLLKIARGVQQLLDTVRHILPQVGNLSLFFLLLFFIYASLGVELLGRMECPYNRCEGLSRHANFHNFGMALLTLLRIATGDQWEEIMEDVVKVAEDPNTSCFAIDYDSENSTLISDIPSSNGNDCAIVTALAPIYFASFYLLTQFFLVNVIVTALMHHMEEAEKKGLLPSDGTTNQMIPRDLASNCTEDDATRGLFNAADHFLMFGNAMAGRKPLGSDETSNDLEFLETSSLVLPACSKPKALNENSTQKR